MTTKENEFGDKIGKSDIYAGILFWIGLAGIVSCAFLRGCQEIKKHRGRAVEKARIAVQPHDCR